MTDNGIAFKLPSIIQRVIRRKSIDENAKGFGRIFKLDYMGSSEFEWGAIPTALNAMISAKNNKWEVRVISIAANAAHKAATAYFVGAPGSMGVATQLFEDQLRERGDRKGHTKERTDIRETYFPERESFVKLCAWWAIDANPPFFLFKDRNHAEELLALL